MKFYILLALLLLTACVKPIENQVEAPSQEKELETITGEPEDEIITENSIVVNPAELERQRKRESVRDLFDFSILTPNNCDFYYQYLEKQLIENRKEISDLKNKLYFRNKAIEEALADFKEAELTGNEDNIDKAKERYDELVDEADSIENEIDSLNKKDAQYVYIIQEIKEECIFLSKRKA